MDKRNVDMTEASPSGVHADFARLISPDGGLVDNISRGMKYEACVCAGPVAGSGAYA